MTNRDALYSVAYPVVTGLLVAAGAWLALNLVVDVWITASREAESLTQATLLFLAVGLVIGIITITPKGTGLVAAAILAAPLVPFLIDGSTWLPDLIPGNPLVLFSESASWTVIWAMVAIDVFRVAKDLSNSEATN